MSLVVDFEKKEKIQVSSKKVHSKVPHLKLNNGSVQINANDSKQKKWFEEFKK